jgi:hypothetical protein
VEKWKRLAASTPPMISTMAIDTPISMEITLAASAMAATASATYRSVTTASGSANAPT